MSEVLDAAARSSTSLTFGGFFTLLLVLALRQVVGSLEWFSERPKVRTTFELVSRGCLMLSTIVMIVGFAGYIIEQIRPPKPPKPPRPPLENRIIKINAKEWPLQEIFKEVARQADARPILDPKLTGTFSISMDGEVKDFMNAICYEAEMCTWKTQPGDPPALVVLPPGAVPLTTGGE